MIGNYQEVSYIGKDAEPARHERHIVTWYSEDGLYISLSKNEGDDYYICIGFPDGMAFKFGHAQREVYERIYAARERDAFAYWHTLVVMTMFRDTGMLASHLANEHSIMIYEEE